MSGRTRLVMAVASLAASLIAAQINETELPSTCSGGGAFGLYRRESGCHIGSCDCFPVIYQCDESLASGLGQCALSRVGWMLIVGAFAINLIVPGVYFLSHYFMESAKDKSVSSSDSHVQNAMDQATNTHGQYYIDLRQFQKVVPDTAYGLRADPKIFMETMSKRWVHIVCYGLLLAFTLCCLILVPSVSMHEKEYPLIRQDTHIVNATAYDVVSTSTDSLPGSTRYLSIQGDFCAVANDILPPEGAFVVHAYYTISFAVDGAPVFEPTSGHKALQCECTAGQCALNALEADAPGAMPLVYLPWYQDAWHPFMPHAAPAHNFTLRASLAFASPNFIPFMQMRPVPRLVFLAHHAWVDQALEMGTVVVFALDLFVLVAWAASVRAAPWLPERRLIHTMMAVNVASSCPVLYATSLLDAVVPTVYYFGEGYTALACGLWLLCLLFLIDMQRTRRFRTAFFLPKLILGVVVFATYLYAYRHWPAQYVSLLNLGLAMLCSTLYHGLMVDVRNHLRAKPYSTSRPEQLTARLLYGIGIGITVVFFAVALVADPVPTAAAFVPATIVLTDVAVLVAVRAATWALAVLFLPPTAEATANVYYMRARSKLPRLTRKDRDFSLAHLKQAVGGSFPSARASDAWVEWRAPDAFVVETACGLYNQSIAVYEEPTADAHAALGYRLVSHAHFDQDGLALHRAFYDAPTDTYGWVLTGDKRIVVVFRGTASAANVRTDLMLFQAEPAADDPITAVDHMGAGVRVHAGIWAAYDAVQHQVHTLVREAVATVGPEFQLYFTGHSLGGALATLAAYDFSGDPTWQLREDIVVYSFGAPRVGNDRFARAYNRRVPATYRVCADGDAIVALPSSSVRAWCSPHLRYAHVGHHVLLSTRARGTFLINPNIVERAFMARLRVNPVAHLGPAYRNLLEHGIAFAKEPQYRSGRNLGEGTPLLDVGRTV